MHCLIVGDARPPLQGWFAVLENLGEAWRCQAAHQLPTAGALLRSQPWDMLILCGAAGLALARHVASRPPVPAPFIVAEGFTHPLADWPLTLSQAESLPRLLHHSRTQGLLPRCALAPHARLCCLAQGLMHALAISPGLRAGSYLADMAALIVVQPALMQSLNTGLYPLVARRHGATPAAVERSLRLLIESTWSHGSLPALERFFGHSVDPERGKPTNKEFLFRLHEHLTLAARRMA